jgi:hypothetical protein
MRNQRVWLVSLITAGIMECGMALAPSGCSVGGRDSTSTIFPRSFRVRCRVGGTNCRDNDAYVTLPIKVHMKFKVLLAAALGHGGCCIGSYADTERRGHS